MLCPCSAVHHLIEIGWQNIDIHVHFTRLSSSNVIPTDKSTTQEIAVKTTTITENNPSKGDGDDGYDATATSVADNCGVTGNGLQSDAHGLYRGGFEYDSLILSVDLYLEERERLRESEMEKRELDIVEDNHVQNIHDDEVMNPNQTNPC